MEHNEIAIKLHAYFDASKYTLEEAEDKLIFALEAIGAEYQIYELQTQ